MLRVQLTEYEAATLFTVTPKQYADAVRRSQGPNSTYTDRSAQRHFKRKAIQDPVNYRWFGGRIFARATVLSQFEIVTVKPQAHN